jgi:mRNA interferase YafQ
MLLIKKTTQFKKDFKKALKQNKDIELLKSVIVQLSNREKLEAKYSDHQLSGNLKQYRDCHIEPDWVLIYKATDKELSLVRIGSHSELFKA